MICIRDAAVYEPLEAREAEMSRVVDMGRTSDQNRNGWTRTNGSTRRQRVESTSLSTL
jgi:hypothetical protein